MKYTKEQKKRFFIVISAAFLALAVVAAASCFIAMAISNNSIKGEWKSEEEKITYCFHKGNDLIAKFDESTIPVVETQYSGELSGEYSLNKKNGTVVVTINYYNKKLTQKYSYEIKNKCLALKNLDDGKVTVFNRLKT